MIAGASSCSEHLIDPLFIIHTRMKITFYLITQTIHGHSFNTQDIIYFILPVNLIYASNQPKLTLKYMALLLYFSFSKE